MISYDGDRILQESEMIFKYNNKQHFLEHLFIEIPKAFNISRSLIDQPKPNKAIKRQVNFNTILWENKLELRNTYIVNKYIICII